MKKTTHKGPKTRKRPIQPKSAPARFWVGVNIHAARRKASMTQAGLARKAQISVKTLYNIENVVPETNFTFFTLETIAEALKTTPLALLQPGEEKIPKV